MQDKIVITQDQLQQVYGYLDTQPHKFAAPLVQFLNQLAAPQIQPAQTPEVEEPAAERE